MNPEGGTARVTDEGSPEPPASVPGSRLTAIRSSKLLKRTSTFALADRVPRITAKVALVAAIRTESQAASSSCRLCRSSPYHLVDNPDQTVTRLYSLNEYMISRSTGI